MNQGNDFLTVALKIGLVANVKIGDQVALHSD
jgi:hypothetical protein